MGSGSRSRSQEQKTCLCCSCSVVVVVLVVVVVVAVAAAAAGVVVIRTIGFVSACVQLIERHLVLMACELIIFILLLTYTSSSRQSVTPTPTSSNTSTSASVQHLKPLSASESRRSVLNAIDTSVSPRRRRSVDDPRELRSDVKQQTVKSGR